MLYPQSDTRPARIFISHADEDKEFAKAVVTLLTAIGIDTKNSILCTSESGLGIKVGKDWVDELKRCFTDYRTYVIIIHSSHLYLSPVSMNEMGAAWVKDCPVFSFLVNGFMEGSMAGVFTSNHQGVLVGRKDIAPDVDQLKEEVTELFGLKPIQEEDWVAVRGEFINTIISLPADRGIVRSQFDINLIERIHIQINPLLGGDEKNEEQNIKWADILKAVEGSLRRPHTEKAIVESLKNVFEGIVEDDCKAIIDKLYEYGLAETRTITTEYDGISVAWYFTEKGRDAYARSMNYHLQPINQERDKAQVVELMSYFSTYAMDEYMREGPDYITDTLLISTDVWKGIIGGSAFQIFSPSLLDVLKPFYELLFQMTSHGECYQTAGRNKYRIYQPEFGPINKRDEATINWLRDNMPEMRKRYVSFIEYVKAQYPDIDLKETSEHFEKDCR